MKTVIPSALRGAKDSLRLPHPTPAQERYLSEEVRPLLELARDVARSGRRLRHARHEAPEVVALDFVVLTLERALDLAARARAEGRELSWILPTLVEAVDSTPALRLEPERARVISLESYRQRG